MKYQRRDKNWIRSAAGGRIYLDHGDYSPWAIANGYAKVCRYGGQSSEFFYSDAQHTVLVARYAPAEFEIEALLHDCAEALGMGDVCRPWKQEMRRLALSEARSHYDRVSEMIERAVADHYGAIYPWPAAIKEVDTRIVADEIRSLFKNPEHQYEPGVTGYGIEIVPIENWREARDLWLETWYAALARRDERRVDYFKGD